MLCLSTPRKVRKRLLGPRLHRLRRYRLLILNLSLSRLLITSLSNSKRRFRTFLRNISTSQVNRSNIPSIIVMVILLILVQLLQGFDEFYVGCVLGGGIAQPCHAFRCLCLILVVEGGHRMWEQGLPLRLNDLEALS